MVNTYLSICKSISTGNLGKVRVFFPRFYFFRINLLKGKLLDSHTLLHTACFGSILTIYSIFQFVSTTLLIPNYFYFWKKCQFHYKYKKWQLGALSVSFCLPWRLFYCKTLDYKYFLLLISSILYFSSCLLTFLMCCLFPADRKICCYSTNW